MHPECVEQPICEEQPALVTQELPDVEQLLVQENEQSLFPVMVGPVTSSCRSLNSSVSQIWSAVFFSLNITFS